MADRARLLDSDSEPEQPDPVAARATIAPYLETSTATCDPWRKIENDMHKVDKYSDITDNTYTKQQVVKMEADILKLLKFEMGSPTARTFLRRYITLCRRGDVKPDAATKTGYKVSDLDCCILTIHELQLIGGYPGLEEEAIKLKYSHSELESVSAMASPRKIPEKFLKDIKQ
ncbi:hypothetical protein ACQ4PT_039364 [Festuca glaucescens]